VAKSKAVSAANVAVLVSGFVCYYKHDTTLGDFMPVLRIVLICIASQMHAHKCKLLLAVVTWMKLSCVLQACWHAFMVR
jgi:hypothetical protein